AAAGALAGAVVRVVRLGAEDKVHAPGRAVLHERVRQGRDLLGPLDAHGGVVPLQAGPAQAHEDAGSAAGLQWRLQRLPARARLVNVEAQVFVELGVGGRGMRWAPWS